MKGFKSGERVEVTMVQNEGEPTEITPPAKGRVVRLLNRDDGAWVALEQRQEKSGVHPFPGEDEMGRGTWVLTYPEYYSPVSEKDIRKTSPFDPSNPYNNGGSR